MQEEEGGDADGEHRDGQGAQVERVLADLADDQQDEEGVDHINVDVAHADTVRLRTRPGRRPAGGLAG